jgi:cyclase
MLRSDFGMAVRGYLKRLLLAGALPLAALLPLGPLSVGSLAAQAPPGSAYAGPVWNIREIQPGIYFATGTGSLTVMSNAAIVINEEDVLVVDTHVSPAAAYTLREELKAITNKPIRYVVNSHYHFDHAHGNQIYDGVAEIIGHEYAWEALASGLSLQGRTRARYLDPIPGRVQALRAQLDSASTPESRATLEGRLLIQENFLDATNSVVPTPPTVTLSDRLTLYRGGREIQLIHLGRGHTAGDIVVFLPAERIVMTGDLFYGGLPYMGDGYIPDWIDTLENLKALDFDLIMPGHGNVVTDKARITYLQAYLRDLWSQIAEMHAAGIPAAEAARRVDLRDHRENFPQAGQLGVDIDAVERGYELLDWGVYR